MGAGLSDETSVSIREQLGGPRLISLATWGISAAVGFLIVVAEALRASMADALGLCAVGVVGVLVPGVIQFVAGRTFARSRAAEPVSLTVVFAVLVPTSATFFVSLSLYADREQLDSFSYGYGQLLISIVLGVAWYCVLIVILDLRDAAGRIMAVQLVEQAQLDHVAVQQDEIASAIEREIRKELEVGRERVGALRRDVGRTNSEEVYEMAATLREVADVRVRALSHRIGRRSGGADLRPGPWAIARTTWQTQKFRPIELGVSIFAVFIIPESEAFGVVRGGGLLLVGVAALMLIMQIGNYALVKLPDRRRWVLSCVFILLQVNTYLANRVRNHWVEGHVTAPYFVAQVLLSALFVLVSAAVPLWRSSRLRISPLFTESIDRAARDAYLRNEQMVLVARRAAHLLHGEVQSRLHACAMSIDAARNSNDIAAVTRSLDEAQRVLGSRLVLQGKEQRSHVNLVDEVARKVKLWKGLVDIDCTFDSGASTQTGDAAIAVGRVVEEGIANAVRHGHAARIDISIVLDADRVLVTVRDDGDGICRSVIGHPRGLGLSAIEHLSHGEWSLEEVNGRTVLSAAVPAETGTTVAT
jgi:two-component sensor histidine kinase